MTTVKAYPGTLAQALKDNSIKAGDRILLKGGTYTGDYDCRLNGITFMSHPGEWAVIDGSLTNAGNDNIFQNLEVKYSSMVRQSAEAGSAPSDIPIGKIANLRGNGNKYIGCIFHDLAQVVWFGVGGEMHDCISYFHGWTGTDGKHGHAYYIHNGPTPKRMVNCIGLYCHGYGIHLYGTSAAQPLDNIYFRRCIMVGAGQLPAGGDDYNIGVGGEKGSTADNITIEECITYNGKPTRIGYVEPMKNVKLINNRFDGITYQNATITEETGNEYGIYNDKVYVHPSEVIPGRGNIIIYNIEAKTASVTVDISSILKPGDSYRLHNVYDYFGDIATGTVAEKGTIQVDMQTHSTAVPVALAPIGNGFPNFGAFVLEKT